MKNRTYVTVLTLGMLCAIAANLNASEIVFERVGKKNCYTTTDDDGNKTTECIEKAKKTKNKAVEIIEEQAGDKHCYTSTYEDGSKVTECVE